jgi:ketosteroid isomerase-like protein
MARIGYFFMASLIFVLLGAPGHAQQSGPPLTGLYRIDIADSDPLYSVIESASSNLPYREQQRFFLDLAVRLTPPDQLAIERVGSTVNIASSRAPRISFDADGITHPDQTAEGRRITTRAVFRGNRLVVNIDGRVEDKFNVTFEPIDNGRRLRVTRRIYANELNSPVVINSVYDKVSELANWAIYGEPETGAPQPTVTASASADGALVMPRRSDDADVLRRALNDWIAATNARDINKQMSFYPATVKAFYLTRNVLRSAVRAEKEKVFERAESIDVRAREPETLFIDGGRTAVMRFRKAYDIRNGRQSRSGEVIQELRWQRTPDGWKIISERDVKVLK